MRTESGSTRVSSQAKPKPARIELRAIGSSYFVLAAILAQLAQMALGTVFTLILIQTHANIILTVILTLTLIVIYILAAMLKSTANVYIPFSDDLVSSNV